MRFNTKRDFNRFNLNIGCIWMYYLQSGNGDADGLTLTLVVFEFLRRMRQHIRLQV